MRGNQLSWVIKGEISKGSSDLGYNRTDFDSIPHSIIISQLEKLIKCDRTLLLIRKFLNVGYLDSHKKLITSKIGIPQGSILSP